MGVDVHVLWEQLILSISLTLPLFLYVTEGQTQHRNTCCDRARSNAQYRFRLARTMLLGHRPELPHGAASQSSGEGTELHVG